MSEVSDSMVVIMGIGTVFVGLIFLIILSLIMSAICQATQKKQPKESPVAAAPVVQAPIENREEIIAAVSATVAEELGTDISAIRILSFKKK